MDAVLTSSLPGFMRGGLNRIMGGLMTRVVGQEIQVSELVELAADHLATLFVVAMTQKKPDAKRSALADRGVYAFPAKGYGDGPSDAIATRDPRDASFETSESAIRFFAVVGAGRPF